MRKHLMNPYISLRMELLVLKGLMLTVSLPDLKPPNVFIEIYVNELDYNNKLNCLFYYKKEIFKIL